MGEKPEPVIAYTRDNATVNVFLISPPFPSGGYMDMVGCMAKWLSMKA
jgi:hypothetical protein